MSFDEQPQPDQGLDDLIHAADLDGLVRMIDDRCATGDWDGLLRVRDGARGAVKTGRQLWPAATLAEYRLALLGPARHVAAVLDETDGLSGQFTIGPLTEVAAQHHTWDELSAELQPTPRSAFVAHERALRGEAVTGDFPDVLDIPIELEGWEPKYALATYRDNDAEFPAPRLPSDWEEIDIDNDADNEAERLDDDVELAVQQLVEPWLSGSNGTVDVACVEGDISDAIGALGPRRARICSLDVRTAMAWMAWAGASGGAHGRRRGAATGRFGAWWILGALGDFIDDWPVDPDALGQFANELNWYRWDAFEPSLGWTLQLGIEDESEGVAWAISARDSA